MNITTMASVVYELVPKDGGEPNERYIGSTNDIVKRMNTHRNHSRNRPDVCKSSLIINKYGLSNVKYVILEICPEGINPREREQHYLDTLPNINGMPAYKTAEQKAETRKVINARYRESQNYQVDCECGGTYSYANRHSHFKRKKHLEYVEKQSSV